METDKIIILASLWGLIKILYFSGEPEAKLPEGCRKLYNFCCLRQCFGKGHKNITASGEVLRTFPSSAAKDFSAVTLQ